MYIYEIEIIHTIFSRKSMSKRHIPIKDRKKGKRNK